MVDTNREISGQNSIDASHSDENVGKIVKGTVSKVTESGVFVNWGIRGRMWGRIKRKELSDHFDECERLMATLKKGDKLEAMVIGSKDGKLSLSVKALTRKRKEEERKRKEEERKRKEEERKRKEEEFIRRCTPGQILDASVVELREKDIVVKIGREGIEECILRKDLPQERIGELFEGMPLQLEYKGFEDGKLMFGMKRGYDYEGVLFTSGVEDLLETMGIRGTCKFIGRAEKGFLSKVISVSDDMANDGKLLIDPVTGECLRVLLPSKIRECVQDGKYYEVELIAAPEDVRRKTLTSHS